jgi:hypothetical protein
VLEPAVKNLAAGEAVIHTSAVVKGEKMARYFTVAFLIVILVFHVFVLLVTYL